MEARTLFDYGRMLWRRRVWVALAVLAASGAGYALSFAQAPVYESFAQFHQGAMSLPRGAYSGALPELLAIREVLLSGVSQVRRYSYRGLLESAAVRARVHRAVPDKPLEELERDVEVTAPPTLELWVRVRDADPELAARVARAYPQALESLLRDLSDVYRFAELATVERSLGEARGALAQARAQLQRFFESQGTAQLETSNASRLGEGARGALELESGGAALHAIERRVIAIESRLRAESPWTSLADSSAAPAGALARDELQRAAEPGSLHEALRGGLAAAELEQASLGAALAARLRALRELQLRLRALPAQEGTHASLRAQVQHLERMVTGATVLYEETRAQLARRPSHVVALNEVRPAEQPVLPAPGQNALLGGLLGLLLAGYGCAARESWLLWRGSPLQPGESRTSD